MPCADVDKQKHERTGSPPPGRGRTEPSSSLCSEPPRSRSPRAARQVELGQPRRSSGTPSRRRPRRQVPRPSPVSRRRRRPPRFRCTRPDRASSTRCSTSGWRAPSRSSRTSTVTTASTGSGTGVSAAATGTVQIGASDAYLSPTQVSQYPGLMNIPLAISSQFIAYNVPGRQRQPEADRQASVRHLPGPGHQLGRLTDQVPQPGSHASEPADRDGAPFGQLGRHLLVHVLPVGHRPEWMGSEVQLQHLDPIPERPRAPRVPRRTPGCSRHARRPRAASPTSG